jgi:hypothetical protein
MNFVQIGTLDGVRSFTTSESHFDVQPLGHADLATFLTEANAGVPVTLRRVHEVTQDGSQVLDGPLLDVSLSLTYHGQVRFYGLVVGGWLPPLIGNGRVALLDRNMVHRLKILTPASNDGSEPDPTAADWLYRMFSKGTFEVSLAAHLLEGRTKRQPTLQEMADEMQGLAAKLKANLPNAKLHELGPDRLRSLHALLLERQDHAEKKTAYLLEVAPLLAHPVGPAARRALEDRVFDSAHRAGLRRTDLCVVAALSCIYEDPELPGHKVYRPGRAVLKPKPVYSRQQAHNALADLATLELLVNSTTMLVNYGGVFLTEDVGLVAFWSALEASEPVVWDTRPGMAQTTLTMTLSHALVPGLSEEERADLAERLGAYD